MTLHGNLLQTTKVTMITKNTNWNFVAFEIFVSSVVKDIRIEL